ncbi:hypothetical protein K443DRAFT_126075 [Laccaria amethystina LaAM-08-1]|uniref:HNH nuclease domain-containing protein n=1 Tax=Laccaria amethystina LaAM-08-1 TaxID=1095629 RepID=A0A0C9WHY0_9AGAR|nr:hypothetical protein K443DRAFT_126075 [Laccaria amethystina LaAM-08-1]
MVKMFSADQRNIFTCRKPGDEKATVNLHAVMSAMLTCAEECGGESGKRYVASAITSCGCKGDDNTIELLAALGTTWLTHLLFICKFQRLMLPRLRIVRPRMLGKEQGTGDARLRKIYTCVVTELYDVSHPAPNPDPDLYSVDLEACRILRRVIDNFDKDHESDSFISAATSFDLLVKFTGLPVTELGELHEIFDDPSNGMLLASDPLLRPLGLSRKHENMLVTFADHSGDFIPGSSRKKPRSIPLPNPRYLAIHAAIAGILHMSGAGKFFDELLEYARR